MHTYIHTMCEREFFHRLSEFTFYHSNHVILCSYTIVSSLQLAVCELKRWLCYFPHSPPGTTLCVHHYIYVWFSCILSCILPYILLQTQYSLNRNSNIHNKIKVIQTLNETRWNFHVSLRKSFPLGRNKIIMSDSTLSHTSYYWFVTLLPDFEQLSWCRHHCHCVL